MSDTDRLNEIRARLDAATAGPWEVGDPWLRAQTVWTADGTRDEDNGTHCAYCHLGSPEQVTGNTHTHRTDPYSPEHLITNITGQIVGNYDYEEGGILAADDTQFIAHAREDIPWLLDQLAEVRAGRDVYIGAHRVASASADRFRDVLCEVLGTGGNPGDDALVAGLRAHFGLAGPEPTRWRDFLTGALAQIDQIHADKAATLIIDEDCDD